MWIWGRSSLWVEGFQFEPWKRKESFGNRRVMVLSPPPNYRHCCLFVHDGRGTRSLVCLSEAAPQANRRWSTVNVCKSMNWSRRFEIERWRTKVCHLCFADTLLGAAASNQYWYFTMKERCVLSHCCFNGAVHKICDLNCPNCEACRIIQQCLKAFLNLELGGGGWRVYSV